jgi:hypothetical protein
MATLMHLNLNLADPFGPYSIPSATVIRIYCCMWLLIYQLKLSSCIHHILTDTINILLAGNNLAWRRAIAHPKEHQDVAIEQCLFYLFFRRHWYAQLMTFILYGVCFVNK